MDIINILYSLTLILLNVCVITAGVAIVYIIGVIKYTKKHRLANAELKAIKINNIVNKENI